MGPNIGYFPKPAKPILIVKNKKLRKAAKKLLMAQDLHITGQSERRLGVKIAIYIFKDKFVKNKVGGWPLDLKLLSTCVPDDPQAVYL